MSSSGGRTGARVGAARCEWLKGDAGCETERRRLRLCASGAIRRQLSLGQTKATWRPEKDSIADIDERSVLSRFRFLLYYSVRHCSVRPPLMRESFSFCVRSESKDAWSIFASSFQTSNTHSSSLHRVSDHLRSSGNGWLLKYLRTLSLSVLTLGRSLPFDAIW